ncbi:MAG: flavodoxin family protein [Bacillota bacterium]|nr:flavodoxin family protein [Bacillota bacterium]
MKKILVLCGSGRRHGNSESLADAFIKGAAPHNQITKIALADKKIAPCRGCNYCQKHYGECIIRDDMHEVFDALQSHDVLVLCSPVYYLGFSAQIKAVIDRTYAESAIGRKIESAILIAVAGKNDPYVSECMMNTYRQLCDYLGFQNRGMIVASGFENPEDIKASKKLNEAFTLGTSIL